MDWCPNLSCSCLSCGAAAAGLVRAVVPVGGAADDGSSITASASSTSSMNAAVAVFLLRAARCFSSSALLEADAVDCCFGLVLVPDELVLVLRWIARPSSAGGFTSACDA